MAKLLGRTQGLKPEARRRLLRLYRRRLAPRAWISSEVAWELARLAVELQRMVGILVDRRGRVRAVSVGTHREVPLPPLPERPPRTRLSGFRFLFTAPPGRGLGGEDRLRLTRHRLDALCRITAATPPRVERAHLVPAGTDGRDWQVYPPVAPEALPLDFLPQMEALAEEFRLREPPGHATEDRERALLVATPRGEPDRLAADLAELRALVAASGGLVVGEVIQRRPPQDPRTLIGRGKVEEVSRRALETGADLVVFLADLTPSQANNLAEALNLKIVDRTQLILDIFAQRAATSEGKLQVELARLRYLLPRLVGRGESLSQLGGGIGSNRGVGETQLELDRRHFKEAIRRLERRLELVRRRRALRRAARRRRGVPVLALVGYTNAGKTTLLNALTGAEKKASPQLFQTLETTARRLRLPSGRTAILTDTVGFIRDLPRDLQVAFRATLEELREATALLHVVDASEPEAFARAEVVVALLKELGVGELPRLTLFNKADRIDRDAFRPFLAAEPQAMLLSALDRGDLERLRRRLDAWLAGRCWVEPPPPAEPAEAPAPEEEAPAAPPPPLSPAPPPARRGPFD